jgi:dihydroneopterin aldolase
VTLLVRLDGIELHAHHGVLEHERRLGQRFLVDVELELVDDRAASTDELADAVDYREVAVLVRTVSDERAYNLLEAFSTAVADALLAAFPVRRARVRVRKPDLVLDPPAAASVVAERRAVP